MKQQLPLQQDAGGPPHLHALLAKISYIVQMISPGAESVLTHQLHEATIEQQDAGGAANFYALFAKLKWMNMIENGGG